MVRQGPSEIFVFDLSRTENFRLTSVSAYVVRGHMWSEVSFGKICLHRHEAETTRRGPLSKTIQTRNWEISKCATSAGLEERTEKCFELIKSPHTVRIRVYAARWSRTNQARKRVRTYNPEIRYIFQKRTLPEHIAQYSLIVFAILWIFTLPRVYWFFLLFFSFCVLSVRYYPDTCVPDR